MLECFLGEQKIEQPGWCFLGEQKTEQPWWCFSGEQKTEAGWCYFFPEQKICSSNFCCRKSSRLVCRLGEIFINLFFDLRLDLPIYFIHYIWMISLFWDHLV